MSRPKGTLALSRRGGGQNISNLKKYIEKVDRSEGRTVSYVEHKDRVCGPSTI
jgi:hypothetical protein